MNGFNAMLVIIMKTTVTNVASLPVNWSACIFTATLLMSMVGVPSLNHETAANYKMMAGIE